MGFSLAVRENMIKALFGITAIVSYSTIYFGMSKTPPTDDGNNIVEPVGGGYSRQSIANTDLSFSADTEVVLMAVNRDIIFSMATQNWCGGLEIPYVVLYSQAAGGVFLGWGEFYTPKTILVGDIFSVKANKFNMGLY